jgi:uncharacterized protein (DUF2336 family)
VTSLEEKILGENGDTVALTYEETKELASHSDPRVRQATASRAGVRPELLYFLAEDPSPAVRRCAALNTSTPIQADLKLVTDDDEDVRAAVAEKVARIAPGLAGDENERMRQTVYDALMILTHDQITRIRRILSESLKDVVNAPHTVVRRLAEDDETVVATPVLEFSPVLTDDDLLEIIEAGPAAGGLGAISRRSKVNESVADAVASTDDVEAITDLLSNTSAQIREETLDRLIDRAPDVELWHAPLAGRPHLAPRAATRLARFLADNLLEVLQQRTDLDVKTLDSVKAVVRRRIEKDGMRGESTRSVRAAPAAPLDFMTLTLPINMVRGLRDAGKLDGGVILKALHSHDYAFVLGALATLGELSSTVVQRVFAKKSTKGIVAMAWKAGLTAENAVALQQVVARIAPAKQLCATEDGRFPLSEKEMTKQLRKFANNH